MLLSRYSAIDFILEMSVDDGAELIIKALEKQTEERAWGLYETIYGNMTEENYIPFDKFYNPKVVVEEVKTAEEILEEIKEMMNSTEWR